MKKSSLKILLLLLSLSLYLTACNNSTQESDAVQASDSAEADSSPNSSKDTINLCLNQVIETLNPYASSSLIDNQLFYQLYDTLFFFNDNGELEPRLAESWEVAEDGKTYTIKLREDAKFHNGEPVTAEDAAWSLDYEFKTGPFTNKRNVVGNFESSRVIDDYTFEIVSTDTSASFLNCIAQVGYILEKDMYLEAVDNETIGNEWVPFGSGPYMVSSYNPDAEIQLEALFFASTFSSKMQIEFLKVAWGISPLLHFLRRHSFGCRRGAVAGIQSLLVTDM